MSVAADPTTTLDDIKALFADVGADVALHAVDVQTGASVGIDADRSLPMASMFKIPVMLAFAIDAVEGRLDWDERLTVTADDRVPGGTGLSVFADHVELSLRDVALLMMTVSDNTASDLILDRVGKDRVAEILQTVGLRSTAVVHDCGEILGAMIDEIGMEKLMGGMAVLDPAELDALTVVDPARTNRSTPREVTTLLRAIWRDEAGPAEACVEVRRVMSQQVWPHRLAAGVPDGARYAGKTGTLPARRHEAGVVTLSDGSSYAIAVFTTAHDYRDNRPDIDAAIGTAGRVALDALRDQPSPPSV